MRTLQLRKAQGFGGDGSGPDSVTLVLQDEFPSCRTLESAMELHTNDATALEAALHATLPGGTYDRLFAVMAQRKVSHFIVSHERSG